MLHREEWIEHFTLSFVLRSNGGEEGFAKDEAVEAGKPKTDIK